MSSTPYTLDELLLLATKYDRVCPLPQEWSRLFELLPDKRRAGNGWEPALPLILAAWHDTPPMLKMLRLREHIEWAGSHGALSAAGEFLESLPEEKWLHLGE